MEKKLENKYGNDDREKQGENLSLLFACQDYWNGLHDVREYRRRNIDFRNGRQYTKEEIAAIESQDMSPVTHNYIDPMIRNLLGQYESNDTKPTAVARKQDKGQQGKLISMAIEHAVDVNNDILKDNENLEELMLGGICCARVGYSFIEEKDIDDVKTDNVEIPRLFFNTDITQTTRDNLKLIGTINDDNFDSLCVKFAKSEADVEFLRKLYPEKDTFNYYNYFSGRMSSDRLNNLSFFVDDPNDPTICRYFEVWTKKREFVVRYHDWADGTQGISEYSVKELEEINALRTMQAAEEGAEPQLIDYEERYDYVWYYKYLTPQGYCLQEGRTPYAHQSHPFVLQFYKILDGDIHPLVSTLIDPQKFINKLMMQINFKNGYASKGVLLFPDEGYDEETQKEMAQKWASFHDVIFYKPNKMGAKPEQVYANTGIGQDMSILQAEIEMMQKIIGVNPAIAGEKPQSGTPASRYAQETSNALLNSKDLFNTMKVFQINKYSKMVKLFCQYYDKDKFMEVAGSEDVQYMPDVNDLDYDVTITEASLSPNIQEKENEELLNFVMQGMIPFEDYLNTTTASYAPKLLEYANQRKAEAQQQQMAAMQQAQAQMPQANNQIPQQ